MWVLSKNTQGAKKPSQKHQLAGSYSYIRLKSVLFGEAKA